MKIVIAGGAGFLGNALTTFFEEFNYEVVVLTRNPKKPDQRRWDGKTAGGWKTEIEGADVLINLSGKSVDCRYNQQNREEIFSSRINSTKILQEVVDHCKRPPKVWLNASSATIYMHAETMLMKEDGGITGDDFSMNICKSWEAEFFREGNEKTRKVALRTSIVLGNSGGAYPKLRMLTMLGLGGKQGRGHQMFSWIHVDDFCRAIAFIIDHDAISGVVNVTAPEPEKNEEVMKTLRKSFHIPFGLGAPKFILEIGAIIIQTETELLLKSRNVYPEKLINTGFKFKYNYVADAVEALK